MKKILIFLVVVMACGCFIWAFQNKSSATLNDINTTTVSKNKLEKNSETLSFTSLQQVGMKCSIHPRCPDCNGKGNVCLGATEFFPGVTVLAKGKALMVSKCRRANALDYCGGSRECVKKTRQEQERHKRNFAGGCYAQCQEKNVVCVLTNR